MSGIKDSDNIEALRQRLYERGKPSQKRSNHKLSASQTPVARTWSKPEKTSTVPQAKPETTPAARPPSSTTPPTTTTQTPSRRYRWWIVWSGLGTFFASLIVASAFLILNDNVISGDNIDLSVSGPFTIGGGETLPIDVSITNANTVPIESATLIVEYPDGALSADEERRVLGTERLALDNIPSGERTSVPLQAYVFGEENSEQEVVVSIEYRVQGSNALFYKETDPLRYKISSSPIAMEVTSVKKISSGQEADVTVSLTSNAPSTLQDVVLRAEYPLGFEYTSANPEPTTNRNIWLFEELAPEESVEVVITGVAVGDQTSEHALNFSVGTANGQDVQSVTSVFAAAQTQFEIEEPFLDVHINIGGYRNTEVVLEPNQSKSVSVEVTNTLSDTIYDGIVEVLLSGNAISDLDIGPPNGFYDSSERKITWDVSSLSDLEALQPGDTARVSFSFAPSDQVEEAPYVDIQANVRARRVSESDVSESLLGTANMNVKLASTPSMLGDANHVAGPIPPIAEESTTYKIGWLIEGGTNDMADTIVTASLPTYVTWTGETSGAGSVSYNAAQRTVTWDAGEVTANANVTTSFEVAVSPSVTQIGSMPTIVGTQSLRATDLFTNTAVRTTHPAITTELSRETGYARGNGRVQAQDE